MPIDSALNSVSENLTYFLKIVTLFLYYKHNLYKHIKAGRSEKIKHYVSIIPASTLGAQTFLNGII